MEELNKSNKMNYIPDIVDIEGLQGVNSSQGMEYYMPEMNPYYGMNEMEQNPMWPPMNGMDDMYNTPPMNGMDDMYNNPPMNGMDDMYNMPPMNGIDDMYNMPPMNGMDNMYNMPPMNGMENMYSNPMTPMNGMYAPQGATCAEVISCMATMCYMMSVYLTQMLQGNNGMGMYPTPTYDCDCMRYETMDSTYGYPPLY